MTKRRRRATPALAEYFGRTRPAPMTRAELAERIGVTRAYVDQITRGERTPRLGHAIAIAKLTGVSLERLCRAEDQVDTSA